MFNLNAINIILATYLSSEDNKCVCSHYMCVQMYRINCVCVPISRKNSSYMRQRINTRINLYKLDTHKHNIV